MYCLGVKMRVYKEFILILSFCFRTASLFQPPLGETSYNQHKLQEILKKSANYCHKVENSALFFVCQENIKEIIYQLRSEYDQFVRRFGAKYNPLGEINTFVYDYQLIKKGTQIKESRRLIEENGEKKDEKNAPLKTKRFYSLKSVFGPVGLLGPEHQGFYDYKFIKEEKVLGRKAYVLEALPKKKSEESPNYGKLWVDKEDFSILKIEMEQESLAGFEDLKKEAETLRMVPTFSTIHYYGIEKNGIRFPSKTSFQEEYKVLGGGSFRRSKTEVDYSRYRFFTVDVEVKY